MNIDLRQVLADHKERLANDKSCKRANLGGADLGNADLCGADLGGADLGGANLDGANLRFANLCGADLCGANLGGADLGDSDLDGANLRGANLDFAHWPLHYGSLSPRIDKWLASQLLYHALRAMQSCADEPDVAAVLASEPCLRLANQFHRVRECGIIEPPREGGDRWANNETLAEASRNDRVRGEQT